MADNSDDLFAWIQKEGLSLEQIIALRWGMVRLIHKQLEHKFGPLSPSALMRLKGWSLVYLDWVLISIFDIKSLEEVDLGEEHKNGT